MNKNKKRIDEENGKNIIIITSISALLILMLILILASIKIYFFPILDFPGTMDSWIGASASVVGGALAFGGVWWTISNQNKKRKEDLIIQYTPLLNFSFSGTKVMKSGIIFSKLVISNDSDSLALNIKYSSYFPKNEKAIVFPNKQDFHNIPSHKKQFLSIIICKPIGLIRENSFGNVEPFLDDEKFNFEINIKYNHPLDENIQYTTILECVLEKVVVEKDIFEIPDLSVKSDVNEKWRVSIKKIIRK